MIELSDIEKTLGSFPKVELEDIRHYFGADVPSRARKNEYVSRLSEYIVKEPVKWLGRMLERDLRLLKELVDAGPDVPLYLDYPDFPSVLETVKLLGSDSTDANFRKVWIPKELFDIVSPHVDNVIDSCESTGVFEMERAELGYLEIYGIMTADEFYDRMLDYWEFSHRCSLQEFINMLYDSPVLKLCRYNIEGESYICAPNIFNPEQILASRKSYPITFQKPFKPEEAVKAGSGSPFFVYGLDTKEGKKLVEMLTSLGYSGDDLVREEHDIWVNSQMTGEDDTTEALFLSVSRKQEDIDSFEDYEDCMNTIAEYANSLPKWLLSGYSSDEKHCLRVELQSDEDPLEALMKKNPLLGLFVQPAPADAPCPCGSGFSYRNCHGRYKN